MALKQISVFLENREGRLEEFFKVVNDNNISVLSFSLAESTEYGVLRIIADDPDAALMVFKNSGFSASATDVIAVKLQEGFSGLKKVTDALPEDLNIEYMYVLSTEKETQSIILKIRDVLKAEKALKDSGLVLL